MANVSANVLVCGAGHGGHAVAGYAALKGYAVSMYTPTALKADELTAKGSRIILSGIIEGEGKLQAVSSNLEEVISDNQKIFVITDSRAHKEYSRRLAPYLTGQEVILFCPGVGGALEFRKEVTSINPSAHVAVTETDTCIYACKTNELGHSFISGEKKEVLYASVPDLKKSFIEELYPQFHNTHNPLMGLDDTIGFHVVGMLMNAQRILRGEDFNFYLDGITPQVARMIEKMDEERCHVAKAAGIKPRPVAEWLNHAYGVPIADLYTMVQQTPAYQNTEGINRMPAPKTLMHRYLLEEILLRAIPTVEIGDILGIDTPIYDSMVSEAARLTEMDLKKTSRHLSDMGLTAKDIKEWHLNHGWGA